MKNRALTGAGAVLLFAAACGGPDSLTGPNPLLTPTPFDLSLLGQGSVTERVTAELWVNGNTAYTTTWGTRTTNGIAARGNAIKIWDITSAAPVLVDSVIVADATTLGDIQATADGRYLVVATETIGSLVIYDIQDPRKPVQVSRFQNADVLNGVHTAEVQRVNGTLYAFLSIDPRGTEKARLVILDLSNPAAPSMVFSQVMGNPFVHDVFVRDGILMTALWNDGIAIFDIGGGGKGGTVANPVRLGGAQIVGGKAHNIFWYNDPRTGSKRFALVGEEGPGSIPTASVGDVHVIDVTDLSNPHEVAFYNVPGAGVHNFSADEDRGILYAAYYNGGVRALSIRGDLGTCKTDQKSGDGRCDLRKMNRELAKGPVGVTFPIYVWGVQFTGGKLYASDMVNGLFRLSTVPEF
ncbi:MAG TPA: hypothetical protein VD758_11605 [Gemmatimonadaceae bacterium]|nr:hypothetical protein [Gemmatimonadaceae bacterium]